MTRRCHKDTDQDDISDDDQIKAYLCIIISQMDKKISGFRERVRAVFGLSSYLNCGCAALFQFKHKLTSKQL